MEVWMHTLHFCSCRVYSIMQYRALAVCVLLGLMALSDARSPPRPVACTADYRPVCGENHKTYSNACMAKAAGVSIAKEGKCKTCPCPKIMKPVCGVNKVQYDNACIAKCAERIINDYMD